MPIKRWDLKRPTWDDDRLRIPRPKGLIPHPKDRFAKCSLCGMNQVHINMAWAGKGVRLTDCKRCGMEYKVRICSFGQIKHNPLTRIRNEQIVNIKG